MSVKQGMQVVDRNGPCSPLLPTEKFSLEQILSNDQFRVDSIHRRTSAVSGRYKTSGPLTSSQIKAQDGSSYGVGNYVTSVGFGTPSKPLTLIIDTGSDVTWIQCKPCQQHCNKQNGGEPIFDPSQSSTFANVSCSSTHCTGLGFSCMGSTCLYNVSYGDNSTTAGYYAEDTLTITPDVIQNFRFGCGQNNSDEFGQVAGLLGLGPSNSESFVLQTSDKYQRVFEYCLPGDSSSTGYLTFGRSTNKPNTNYTPIPKQSDPPYYFLNMTGITVGNTTLPIASTVFSNVGMIIDSGTVITRLPPDAYQALSSEFRSLMTQYKMTQNVSLFDTCYDISGLNTTVTVPTVVLHFLNNVNLGLDSRGILFPTDDTGSIVCLAFASTNSNTDFGIFGNVQQRTFNVVYDVPNAQIGFSPGAC